MIDRPGGAGLGEVDASDATAQLLRLAGPRPDVPADRTARVRAAFLAECRAVAERRRATRRALAGILLAAAVLVIAVRVSRLPDAPAGSDAIVVARIERLEGEAWLLPPDAERHVRARLDAARSVSGSDTIETSSTGRVALRLTDGTSVRIDTDTRAIVRSPARIDLRRGALYVDRREESAGLVIQTDLGAVRDIGTQFEVRVGTASLRIRVRSGVVEWRRGGQVRPARAGVELTVDALGTRTGAVAADDDAWRWASTLAPAFPIEGRTLDAYLAHVCREQGWTLRYEDAALARDATGITLHGTVDGLAPAEAIAVALATSGLGHRVRDGELVVVRAVAPADIGGRR